MSNKSSCCRCCGEPLAFDRTDKFWFCPEGCTPNESEGTEQYLQYEDDGGDYLDRRYTGAVR